ncbi:putative toxin-antitoxin system toxin component, PIN family [Patescibacteria group bacterium]|nr:putative toxin-antitoxin system toxin component, PIN family [Patescibacteria group bacterium]
MKAPKVFIDSNVWFSAFYGSTNCEKITKAHTEDKIKAVISQNVLQEIVKNFTQKMPKALNPFITSVSVSPPKIIRDPLKIPKYIKSLAHPKDQMILSSAILAKTPYFVTDPPALA